MILLFHPITKHRDHGNPGALQFYGSNTANGAKASAVLYSIAATAQANGVDTEQYLTKLFSQPVGTIILPLNT